MERTFGEPGRPVAFQEEPKMSELLIRDFMTPAPYTVETADSLDSAEKLMRSHNIRHLPVMEKGELVGIISDRDLHLASSLLDNTPDKIGVEEIYVRFPYRAKSSDTLKHVLQNMVELHISSALVVEDEKLVGIFTTMDACHAFSERI